MCGRMTPTKTSCTHLAHKLLGVLLPQVSILVIKAQLGQHHLRQHTSAHATTRQMHGRQQHVGPTHRATPTWLWRFSCDDDLIGFVYKTLYCVLCTASLQYKQVAAVHFSKLGTIPPSTQLRLTEHLEPASRLSCCCHCCCCCLTACTLITNTSAAAAAGAVVWLQAPKQKNIKSTPTCRTCTSRPSTCGFSSL